MARPKVVITGGAGFIGSHMADALVARTEVVAVDHLKAGKRANLEDAMKAGAVLRKLDILRGDLRPIVRGAEVVYHFAANPDVRLGRDGTKPLIDENVLGTFRVLEACRQEKVPKIVFTSTSTVYGEASVVPTPEDYAPLEPISVCSLADAICDELGLSGVEYRWTGGAGNGRGWARDVRAMQLAIERLRATGWRPRKSSEAAVRDAARSVWSALQRSRTKA